MDLIAFFTGIVLGSLAGIGIMAIMNVRSNSEDIGDAYTTGFDDGFEAGKKVAEEVIKAKTSSNNKDNTV